MKSLFLSLLLTLLLVGCASSNPNDPYESFNRPMFKVNTKVDHAIFKPTAQAYRYVTPIPIRHAIGNFFDNFRDLYSSVNNALRLKPKNSLNDLMRVAINSTFGIGGLINIADYTKLKNNKNNFGDTLATWGWKKSNYLVLPLLGPSTVRDSVGTVIGLAASPDSLIYHNATQKIIGSVISVINTRERLLDITDSVNQAALDEYSYTRDGFMQVRNKQIGLKPTLKTDDFNIDDLVTPSGAATPETKNQPNNKTNPVQNQPNSKTINGVSYNLLEQNNNKSSLANTAKNL